MAGGRWRPWGLGLLISLTWLLGGCFQADLTLRFDHHHHGQWIQTFTVGERNLALASDALDPWLRQVRRSLQPLGGHLQQTPNTLDLTIPFSTPADLVDRVAAVFAPPSTHPPTHPPEDIGPADPGYHATTALTLPGVGTIPFALHTKEQNWGIMSRVQLQYDLDLRGVTRTLTAEGGDLGDGVSFRLQVPWGWPSLETGSLEAIRLQPHEARWILPLGQLSHIAVVFWLPNGVGLGGVALAIIVLLGYVLRYRWLGAPTPPRP
ncbi:MAG: DUF3153 domain-containing protein [Leptolyngbya sp.]|nr:DUF3153 domain-containing protein [Leptolyngbya sp.]